MRKFYSIDAVRVVLLVDLAKHPTLISAIGNDTSQVASLWNMDPQKMTNMRIGTSLGTTQVQIQ